MKFDVRLPDSPAVWMIRAAGIHSGRLADVWNDLAGFDRSQLPARFTGEYFRTENPVKVEVTVFAFEPHAHIQVETPSQHIGRKIREKLARYSVEQQGEDVAEQEHRELWAAIDQILQRDDLSYEQVESGDAFLTRQAIQDLAALCERVDPIHWKNIYKLFTRAAILREDRPFAARWLVRLFQMERDPHEEIGLRIEDLACREIAEDLVPLIKDRAYGERRWPLCTALAKLKHSDITDVMASLLGQGLRTREIIAWIGDAGATWHAGKIRKFVSDPDPDIRIEAEQAIRKLGLPIEAPPPATHLANRKDMPDTLAEWSAPVSLSHLTATLAGLELHIEKGFAEPEIAEVVGVAREMRPGQSKTFQFRITFGMKKCELWIVVGGDEIASRQVAIHSRADLISYFGATTSAGRTGGQKARRNK